MSEREQHKPREINPEDIDDKEFWDLEALKLAVLDPHLYITYSHDGYLQFSGDSGLALLGFLTIAPSDVMGFRDLRSTSFDSARVTNFGRPLIDGCRRTSGRAHG